jgi:NAD+ kinase
VAQENFNTIGIIGKYNDPHGGGALIEVANYLNGRGCRVIIDQGSAPDLSDTDFETTDRATLGQECDLIIVIGGDGTLLNAARSMNAYTIPLVGINLGRLGFLVDVSRDRMQEALDEIFSGKYVEEERFLLHTIIERGGEILNESNAFNDVAIHKSHVARMIELECYVDDKFVSTMRADGLVIASPTGSTAYALSSGGPILHPSLNAIALVPICPHTLSNRPLVVGGDSKIVVRVCEHEQSEVLVTCDGQIALSLQVGDTLKITKTPNPVRLIHPAVYDFYDILRAKLHWAERPS